VNINQNNLLGKIIERKSLSSGMPTGRWKVIEIDMYHEDAKYPHDVHVKHMGDTEDEHRQGLHVEGEEENCLLKEGDEIYLTESDGCFLVTSI